MSDLPQYILTRRPAVSLAQGELSFIERAAVDGALAELQHACYRAALARDSIPLIDLAAEHQFPDSTFVEDSLLALPECFVLCRPGAASRRAEPTLIAPSLPQDRPCFEIKAPATLDGGDVLIIDRELFVGISTRTNAHAVDQLEQLLGGFGYRVQALPVRGALHLKTAVTAPQAGSVLLNPRWLDAQTFSHFQVIEVDPDEPFAGNSLRVGDQLFMQHAHPRTARRLHDFGLSVQLVDISEFAKLEAGLSCMSVLIPAAVSEGVMPA